MFIGFTRDLSDLYRVYKGFVKDLAIAVNHVNPQEIHGPSKKGRGMPKHRKKKDTPTVGTHCLTRIVTGNALRGLSFCK